MRKTYLLALAAGVLAFAADQASKFALLTRVDFADRREIVVTSFFSVVKWWNQGVSFGVFNHGDGSSLQRWLLAVATLAIIAGLLRWLQKTPHRLPAVAIGMIIGGAIGNLLDRFHYGAVADFLYFHWHDYGWPAFNVADSCIVCGVGLLLLDSFLNRSPSRSAHEQS